MIRDWGDLPKNATFTEAAKIADELGVFPGATADKLRYLARTRADGTWPFGAGRPYSYGQVANARTMDAEVLMKHLVEDPPNPNGRGPDKKPRSKKQTS